MLSLQHVCKIYPAHVAPVRAVADVTLKLAAGEFVAVQGASGSGKSTLLYLAGGLLQPDSGEVHVADEDPYQLSAERRAAFRAERIGFVFQQFHLIPYLNVRDNVLAAAMAVSSAEAPRRADELLERFGLQQRAWHLPGELSVGERQRVALARATLNRPRLLLADEPTGNLDHENAEVVLRHLADFVRQGGAVLLVTHDAFAASFAGRSLRLRDGRLVQAEPVREGVAT